MFDWKPEHIKLIGQYSDHKVADMLGLSFATIYNKRRSLGIISAKQRELAERRKYVEEFGKESKEHIALKRSNSSVLKKYPNIASELATKNNTVVAEIYGISRERSRQIRNMLEIPRPDGSGCYGLSDVDQKYLQENAGKMSDQELAGILGMSPSTLCNYRKRNKIESHLVWKSKKRKAILDSNLHRIGKQSDRSLSIELGIHERYIFAYRKENNIPRNPNRKTRWDHAGVDVEARNFVVQKLYNDGLSHEAIAESVGISAQYAGHLCRKMGLCRRKTHGSQVDDARLASGE